MKTEAREISPFSKIKFKDFGTLILTQGDQESLTIEAEDDIFNELVSEVRGDTLVLGLDEDWLNRIGSLISSIFSSHKPKITYTVTFVSLEKISVSGKCDLHCEALDANDLKINVSGLGILEFGQLACDNLDVNISGRGEFDAAGAVQRQEVHISGSGEYQAPGLTSQSARIVISGQGNATVRAAESLDINISGLGQVNYYGQPAIHQVISGVGKSKQLDDA
ncbi:DUF2807 domain-containing protein [bacterium]|nr:DUF2807 domain-containing protein [bacterium]